MKNLFRILGVILLIFLVHSCCKKENNEPKIEHGSVTDYNGNTYNTVKIGTKWWMAENLKVTQYNNGDVIGTTTPATLDISSESTPKYEWPCDGMEVLVNQYGRLYIWYAVTDSRMVCPTGWHVPTDAEWTTLTDYLTNNGYGYQGSGNDIAKSMASNSGWGTDPYIEDGMIGKDQASNNGSGFSAKPSGYRYGNGDFGGLGGETIFWSATEINMGEAWFRNLYYFWSQLDAGSYPKNNGHSVRCLKD